MFSTGQLGKPAASSHCVTVECKPTLTRCVGIILLSVCVLGANFGCGPSSESRNTAQSQGPNSVAVSPPASGDQDNTTTTQQADSNASNSGKGSSNDAPEPEPEPEPKQPDADPPKPERADRVQMTADYQLDPVGAHRRYRDKTFEVEGYLYLIFTEGPHPHPAVSLVDDPTTPTNPALIRLEDAGLIDFLKAVQGEYLSVVLLATCTGYSDKMLQFKDATLVEPTASTVKARVGDLVDQKDATGVLAAEKLLAQMIRLEVVGDEDAKALSSLIESAKAVLADAAKKHWAPLVRQHIEARKFDEAEQAIKYGEAELLDGETAKTLRDELATARTEQEERLAGLLTEVRTSIVSADYTAALSTMQKALDSGDLDSATEKTLRGEIEVAKTVRALLAKDGPVEASQRLELKTDELSEAVRKALEGEITAKLDELKTAAAEAAIQKIKLKDDSEVTLDFSCVADTTRIESVKVTSEDTTGFVQIVYVKVKFTHFAVLAGAEPTLQHGSMSRAVKLSESGEATLKIEKAKIKDNKVVFR